ncbi:hypothetical protein [Aliamphritea spongicola]|nr:hypothetical protein [Aliamphritea spongicola]
MQTALEAMADEGLNVFDQQYQRLNKGQEPAKFDLSYTDIYEKRLQPVMDGFLEELPDVIYAIGVNSQDMRRHIMRRFPNR